MQQYFIKETIQHKQCIVMDKEQAHHIKHVMRMKEGDMIRIATQDACLFRATVQYKKEEVCANIIEELIDYTQSPVSITLLQGMIKKEKWDFLLQKCAELGVTTIVPFVSSRCVVKAKEERLDKKMLRWNKILLEACEQCKRSTLVDLKEPCSMALAMNYKSDLNIIAYEDADTMSEQLYTILQKHKDIRSISIVIGCEGGFSAEEVQQFQEAGYVRTSLGTRILRAETAAMSCINSTTFFYEMEGAAR